MKLWLRWTALVVFVAVLGTVFVTLGQWQLDRLHERQESNALTVANAAAPPRPHTDVFGRPITGELEWLRVEARGTFDAAHQFVVRYRSNDGEKGYEVVTPLITPTGAVLVDRGFVALRPGQQIPATAPPPPVGEVTVVGHVRRNERGRKGATTPAQGQLRLINAPAIAAHLPYSVPDGYLSALSVDPPQIGDLRPVVLPEISDGPHFWYAVQWFGFTALAVTGIVVFIRGDLKDRRTTAAVAAAPAMPGSRHGSGVD